MIGNVVVDVWGCTVQHLILELQCIVLVAGRSAACQVRRQHGYPKIHIQSSGTVVLYHASEDDNSAGALTCKRVSVMESPRARTT